MAKKQIKYKTFGLKSDDYSIPGYGEREPGDPIIEIGYVDINYKTFQKSPAEKAQLKAAKAQCKMDELKRK